DLFQVEDLDEVTSLDVVEAIDADPAFETLFDLLGVILEALEAAEFTLVDQRAAAQHLRLSVAPHDALGDHAAGDHARLRDLEDGADLRSTHPPLDELRRQHALHQRPDIVHDVVDDVVLADLHLLLMSQRG